MQAVSNKSRSALRGLTLARLAGAGLRHHWRTGLAVALAVMAASAVLTGALLVGDSMRGSLRHLLLDQLGPIDQVLVTDRFFRAHLADELDEFFPFHGYFDRAFPAIYLQATIDNPQSQLRAGNVQVIGGDETFWTIAPGAPPVSPAKDEVVLNAPLAAEVGANVGDEVLLRIGSASQIPADSALGRKTETIRNRRLKVSGIIPADGFGRFALNPSQQLPLNAYVAVETLQIALDQPDKANSIFVTGRDNNRGFTPEANVQLQEWIKPRLEDYGLSIQPHKLGYVQLTSNRMLLDSVVVEQALKAFAADRPQPVLTYLANSIAAGDKQIPYSTIAALDFSSEPPLGPFETPEGTAIGPLADDEIALNSWAADDLGVKPGDTIEITYFEPESTHGKVRESKARFKLKAVVAMRGLGNDPDLTPQLPGVTDQLSIGDWDPPFPFDSNRVRDTDEQYWDEHRTTPKAFVSLATGRKLWSSRFGDTTAVRFAPPPGPTLQAQEKQLVLNPKDLGFIFRPVKQYGLQAAAGTTSFGGLFFGFSLFIMVSALLLVALVFRLGVEQRAQELGVLRAVGLRQRTILGVLLREALAVTLIGSVVGVAAGIGYAWLMLEGLRTWWVSAISTPFLQLYVTPQSLLIGFVGGLLVSLGTVLLTLWRLRKISPRTLLGGHTIEDRFDVRTASRRTRWIVGALLLLALISVLSAPWLRGEAQAGAFVGSGALLLSAALTLIWDRLRQGRTLPVTGSGAWPLARLAVRNGARNPLRSTLSIGLVAAASFLIVALSAFRLDPTAVGVGRSSGSGGFTLVAQSDQPLYQSLNTPEGRSELSLSAEADEQLAKCETVSLRVRSGDNASCLNLYQPLEPRLLGASEALIERGGFSWAGSAASTPEERANPWLLLRGKFDKTPTGEAIVPGIVDFNTAMYSLHKALGDTISLRDGRGRPLQVRIVGLLKNSIFQGDVLLGEQAFLELFPDTSGYRFFLVDTKQEPEEEVRRELEASLGDYGFDAERSTTRLTSFFAVQNTYLSTFQSLGGLGLLLGTFGLAAVQLRSVFERRGELALLRATGFRRRRLAQLVMIENGLLLVGGLAVGLIAALVAVLPHWLAGGAAVPWLSLAGTLGLVLVVGLAAGMLAVRATLRAELLPALRHE